MKIIKSLTAALLLLSVTYVSAQEITQTVKGRVTDQLSNSPLSQASVQIIKDSARYGGQTNGDGYFAVTVPVGRYRIYVSYTGYTAVQQELLVISGKETVVNVALNPATETLQAVEVSGAALEQEFPGQRSLTIEKTLRVPANFFDPVRVATAYPGVIAANDQNNAIVVRGNSPNGLLWRLNGLDIVNPNHLANAGTLSDRPAASGGGVNILSAQMLDRTDFYMGALPASYGNALSGVIDMKLRDGNKEKMEYTAQASLIGLDVAAEGPLGKKQNTSFLANYRYSTVGLLSQLGINFGDEAITFQDLSFHLNSKGKKGADFSLFGFYGNSENSFEAKKPEEWKEDKDKYNILYKAATYAMGVNYTAPVFGGELLAGLAYSNADMQRNAVLTDDAPAVEALMRDQYYLTNGLLSASIRYQKLLGEKVLWDIGAMVNAVDNDLKASRLFRSGRLGEPIVWGGDKGLVLQPFTMVTFLPLKGLTVDAGARYVTYLYNSNAGSLEPRLNVKLKTAAASRIDLAYSLVSQLQPAQVIAVSGNGWLDLTRSHHIDLSYITAVAGMIDLKAGLFYQHLFDVPILDGTYYTFSTLNLFDGLAPAVLENKGTGANYGADVTLEKHFYTAHYFMVGGSYYRSVYTADDGIRRSTRFDGNYTINGTYGREWSKPEKNRTFGLSTRVLCLGGFRQSPIDVNNSVSMGETIYNERNVNSEKLNDYFRLDLRLSFRKNKPRYTRTFAIDIQNLTNQQNEAYRYYDFVQQKVVTKYQLGIIPVLVYRIDF